MADQPDDKVTPISELSAEEKIELFRMEVAAIEMPPCDLCGEPMPEGSLPHMRECKKRPAGGDILDGIDDIPPA